MVDDHAVFAEALALAIDAAPDLACVGTAPTVDEALAVADATEPDVVVMDVGLPGTDGLAGTRLMRERHPGVRVLVLTGQAPTPELLLEAVAAGASGLLPKDSHLGQVTATIGALRDGTVAVDRRLLMVVMQAAGRPVPSPRSSRRREVLTSRERQVLELLAAGVDLQTAATHLGLSVHTCRGHLKSLFLKLGAHSQLEAVAAARAQGLLHAPS